jgi:serine/threonine protein kinase
MELPQIISFEDCARFGDESRGPWTRKALLGSGSFGVVHEVVDEGSAQSYALKIEPLKIRGGQIDNEVKILRLLSSVPFLPRVIASGVIGDYRGFVETKMGESLDHILLAAQGTLPLQFMTSVGIDLLTQLERIHMLGIVHRDLKPENVCAASRGDGWSLIDFGLASSRVTTTTSARSFSGTVVGTARYASIAAHQGRPIRPADDIESLCYLLLYACR